MSEIRIQDDLYMHVNQQWIDEAVIPNDRPTTGGFADLDVEVERLMINEFNQLVETKEYPNKHLERACNLFALAKDTKARKRSGIKPALKSLKKIEKLTDISSFNRHIKELAIEGFPLPFEMMIEDNMKDTKHHLLYILGPSTILPDVTYYSEAMAQQKEAMLGLWSNMAQAILAKTNLTEEDQKQYLQDTLKFDAIIATLVKSAEEMSDYTKLYNIKTVRQVSSALKPIKFNKFLKDLFGEAPQQISVGDPRFVKNFKTLFNEDNFQLYKHWAYVNELISSCKYLSEELRDLSTSYRRALTGVANMPSIEKYAYQVASSIYSEPVGLYYGEKYFGEEAKKDVVDMVKEIIETYKSRISHNDFLKEETKAKAIVKLDKMVIKMGYPDKVDALYDKLDFDPNGTFFDAVKTISKTRRLDSFSKLYEDVDRSKWVMPGHMVNACYNPTTNDITFPAAILQAPFYSIKQTRSQNLGGIGAVIGHEISHAFDNNGANCDENGNLVNWWAKEDFKQFANKTKAMIKEFDGIELPWGKVNSKLIVSENIADNGGMAVTLEIMSKMDNPSYEEYFINWAKVWCMKAQPEYLQLLLNVDVHAPAILRANMQPRNFQQWYDTFNVTKKDKMYIAPNKRVIIW